MKKWIFSQNDTDLAAKLSKATGISLFLCKILITRGVTDEEKANEYFNGTEISDPFLLMDMEKAVECIQNALETEKKITVYGDYDCDGITSTVILYDYLTAMGGEVDWYIPDRNEGYGLNIPAIDKIAESGTQLIITVDNGISAVKEAEYIAEKGMELVITDHHQPPEILPRAYATVDPKRKDDLSPCRNLAGVGVTMKLIMALDSDTDGIVTQYGDLAAIGTVGDLVPLVGENRVIVRSGLETIGNTDNIGLTRLTALTNLSLDSITSTSLAYSICPRINAAGRGAHPRIAAELLMSEDMGIADAKAQELCRLNTERRATEDVIVDAIKAKISADKSILNERVLIFDGDGFNHGVIGIVSSRILSEYGKPNMIISVEGDTAKGSARSTDGASLYELLDDCKELLVRFGGHTKAAGFTLKTENLPAFRQRVAEVAARIFPESTAETVNIDSELHADEITVENAEMLQYLQPFGEGNPVPVFMVKNCRVESKKSLKDGKYVSFEAGVSGRKFRVLDFSRRFDDFFYNIGENVDILVNIETNEYNGKTSVVLKLRDIRYSGIIQEKYFAAKAAYEKIMRGEKVNPALIKRIIPAKSEMKTVYDLLRRHGKYTALEESALNAGVNYCMFRVILDVLEEFNLAQINIADNTVKLIPSKEKAETEKSVHLKRLTAMITGKGDES